jgi:Insertion domain in 60S ribosomal protein L10P
MMEQLRKLGLVVEMNNGQLELRTAFIAAKQGEPLTPEQATLLKHLDMPISKFKVDIITYCNLKNGNVEEY